jgi:pyridoxal phosphate enzyme (YggS family)
MKEVFKKKLETIRSELPSDCSLLIVSKTRSIEEIKTYYDLGHRDFGENRVQELQEKAEALKDSCPEIRWHMIGHLQTNKVNALLAVPNLKAIHSVDDRELVEKLIKAEERLPHQVEIYLQFNTSKEAEKSGFETYTELRESAELLLKSSKLKLTGLMTMGTLRTENFEAEAGRCFQELRVEKEKLAAEFGIKLKLSMGMSQDYKIALKEGSNWVRLGTSMFS